MRKPSTYSLRNEEDASDDYSTSAPASTQAYLDDHISPEDSFHKESEDSDGFSDSSKKIRKKRNAYSKISDEIRMKLLDCVKNGETLKSAAKRFKINYSSAKSILHTFRKEGRILKKSAQERTIKKKCDSMGELEPTVPKSARLAKKQQLSMENETGSRSMNNLAGRGGYSKESTPAGSLSRLEESPYEQNQYHGYRHDEEQVAHDEGHHYNKMNYYMNYNDGMVHHHSQESGRNYMLSEGVEQYNNYAMPTYTSNYDSYNDIVSSLHHRNSNVDEFFTDPSAAFLQQREINAQMEDKYFKPEQAAEYYDQGENGYNTLKSFMDTQSIFRDALKKANHVSYSNTNNSGFRKSSIDLF